MFCFELDYISFTLSVSALPTGGLQVWSSTVEPHTPQQFQCMMATSCSKVIIYNKPVKSACSLLGLHINQGGDSSPQRIPLNCMVLTKYWCIYGATWWSELGLTLAKSIQLFPQMFRYYKLVLPLLTIIGQDFNLVSHHVWKSSCDSSSSV